MAVHTPLLLDSGNGMPRGAVIAAVALCRHLTCLAYVFVNSKQRQTAGVDAGVFSLDEKQSGLNTRHDYDVTVKVSYQRISKCILSVKGVL